MDFAIPDELEQLRQLAADTVRELLSFEDEFSRTGAVPPIVNERLAAIGAFGLAIPEEHGGLGLDLLSSSVVLEELAKLPRAFFRDVGVNNGIGSRAIVIAGSEAQKHQYLPRLASGQLLGAFALTEAEAGSDVSSLRTRAERVEGGYVLNGRKQFITNGGKADVVSVLAYTDRAAGAREGMTLFLVERGTEGFRVGSTFRTMEGPPDTVVELILDNCFVDEDHVLGEPGHGYEYALGDLDESRVQIGAQAVGMAQRALDLAVDYATQRTTFGRTISRYQAVQHMIADSAVEVHAARLMVRHAAWRFDRGERLKREAAIVKLFATEMLGRVIDRALQVHGGSGYVSELPLERMYREARLFRIVEGTSEIQRTIIARSLCEV